MRLVHTRPACASLGKGHISALRPHGGVARGAEARVAFVRAALRDDRLRLVAQPIVGLRTGEKVADELLLRFELGNGRLDLPGPYIRAAERYRLAVEIDTWVLERAAHLAARGRDIHMNVSRRTLAEPEFARTVAAALDRHGADASRLTFEITETAPNAGGVAADLARLGARLAVDDFGTGYSSLTDLMQLPTVMLKIDRTFVENLLYDDCARALVESVAWLASRLGQTSVAEGVEDARTRSALLDCGVDLAQGFQLGMPERLG